MNQLVTDFTTGILALCNFVLHYVGFVDDGLKQLGDEAGLDQQRQLYVLLALIIIMVIFALRTVRGFVGWLVVLLLVLLLLHRIIPGVDTPQGIFNTPLQNVMK